MTTSPGVRAHQTQPPWRPRKRVCEQLALGMWLGGFSWENRLEMVWDLLSGLAMDDRMGFRGMRYV